MLKRSIAGPSGLRRRAECRLSLPIETALVSFRIDAELQRKAAEVCSSLGLELQEVLRALIAQTARDGALPFSIGSARSTTVASPSVSTVDRSRLWSDLQPEIIAETAPTLLMRVIADLSSRLSDALDAVERDNALISELTAQRDKALALRQRVDVNDPTAVDEAVSTCRAWLANLR